MPWDGGKCLCPWLGYLESALSTVTSLGKVLEARFSWVPKMLFLVFFILGMGGGGSGEAGGVPCLIHKVQAQKLSRITCFMERKMLLGGAVRVPD